MNEIEDVLKELKCELSMEKYNQYSNDWTNEIALKYYVKGLDYAYKLIEAKLKEVTK